ENLTEPPSSVFGTSGLAANALFSASASFSFSSSLMLSRRASCSRSSSRLATRAPFCDRSPSRSSRTLLFAHSDQEALPSRSSTRRQRGPALAPAPYSERIAPASWPLFCRSCARVTADMAGIAIASIRPATHRATPISISVMPRWLLGRSGRSFAAVDGDVVAAALGLVGAVGVDVVALAGADVAVVRAPPGLVHGLD